VNNVVTDGGSVTRSPRQTRRMIVAASLGTAFEFYDMHIYGLASGLVFAATYFPSENPTLASLAALATFSVGYIARPLGGVVFGHIGDRAGRKRALLLTFLIMGVATMLIGFLPTYAQIGVAAPILLVALRLAQGFAVGGEIGGAWISLVEFAPPNRRGFYGAFVQAGSSLGAIVGSTVVLALTGVLSAEAFHSWGWRIPFLLSGLLIPIGLYVRSRIEESPEFVALTVKQERVRTPIVAVFRDHWRLVFLTAGITMAYLSAVYLATFYSVSFLTLSGASAAFAAVFPMVFLGGHLLVVLVGGLLADRWGRRTMFLTGVAALAVLAMPFFLLIGSGEQGLILTGALVIAVPAGLMAGSIGTFIAETFVGEVRYTGLSTGYQLGSIVGGGLAPVFATLIFAASGKQTWVLGIYLAAVAIIGFACAAKLSGSSQMSDATEVATSTAPVVSQNRS